VRRFVFVTVFFVTAFAGTIGISGQQPAPDISGTWVATAETPANLPLAPTAILGARFAIAQQGKSLTWIRPSGSQLMSSTLEIGGPETKSIVPGATCMGDAFVFETAALEGDAIVLTITGTQAAGASAKVTANARRLVRRLSADTLLVEGFTRAGGEPRQVGTIYRKSPDALTAAARPAAPMAAAINDVQWIAGMWSTAGAATPAPATTTEERWTPPAGGTMLGMARDVRATAMPSFEFLCIVERAGGLVYTAMPNARTPPTDFALTSMTATSATFENPSHDFPKKIRYSLTPEGLLQTEVSGAPGSRTITVTLKKQ
jgi:hypothetical protein